jgi:hypothetical protein
MKLLQETAKKGHPNQERPFGSCNVSLILSLNIVSDDKGKKKV